MPTIAELKAAIKKKASRETRSSGNLHSDSDIDRELSRAGVARKPDDIPKQDTKTRQGTVDPGNVGAFFPSTTRTGKPYASGLLVAQQSRMIGVTLRCLSNLRRCRTTYRC